MVLLATAMGAATMFALGFIYREDIVFALFASPDSKKAMRSLNRVEVAQKLIKSEVDCLKSKCAEVRSGELDDLSQRQLKQLSMDTDFLFEKLDAIMGDDNVRSKRKVLVLKLRDSAATIDELMTTFKVE